MDNIIRYIQHLTYSVFVMIVKLLMFFFLDTLSIDLIELDLLKAGGRRRLTPSPAKSDAHGLADRISLFCDLAPRSGRPGCNVQSTVQ